MKDFFKVHYFKILAILSVIILFIFGFIIFSGKMNKTLADNQNRQHTYARYNEGDEAIQGTEYVTFDAFFLDDYDNDGNADIVRGSDIEIGQTDKLYFELKVLGDVKLINGKITFVNSNARVAGVLNKGALVSSNQSSTDFKTITLNELNNGLTITKPMNIYARLTDDLTSYSGINQVVLTGTVTDLYGNVLADIEKTVDYTVDWYGDNVTATVTGSGKFDEIHPNQNPVVNYTVTSSETAGQLFLKTAYLEGTVSQLNGRDPESVEIYGSDITYDYNPTTRKFTITKESELDGTLLTKKAYDYKNELVSYNNYQVRVTYPYDETDEEGFTSLSVSSWYDAYNNDMGVDSVKTSTKASRIISASFVNQKPGGSLPIDRRNSISVGTKSTILDANYVDKTEATSIYNGANIEEPFEDYRVNWHVYVPSILNDENKGGMTYTLKLEDNNGDKLNNTFAFRNYVKYKSISVTGLASALNVNGTIRVVNADTHEVVHVFYAGNWNTPYTFESDVRSIELYVNGFNYIKEYVDANNYRSQLSFGVNMTKTIDNNSIVQYIPQEDFETYGTITSIMNQTIYNGNEIVKYNNLDTNSYTGYASYVNAESQAYLSISRSQVYTTEESEVTFTITTNELDDISRGFKDGEYFILMPTEILNAKIVSVTAAEGNATIVGSSVGTTSDGRKYIKLITSNSSPGKQKLNIKAKLLPDPRKTDKGVSFTLYAYNPNCHNYRYKATDTFDINGNNDKEEKVSYATASLTLSAPNEMITTSILKMYDNSGNIIVAPLIAEVDPVEYDPEATVEVGLTNNSEFSVDNVRVVGKLAYYDNTYVIGEGSLGSQYNVQMTSDGITYPEELEGKIHIYYSEVETPTDDLNNSANGWTTKENTDFTKVKSYLIVLDNYTMARGKSLTFSYNIEMPMNTADINKVTYFTHGVYYNLITEAGLHASSVGGSKLGIRMSRQYNLELTNLKSYGERIIDGSKYILEDDEGNQTILSTNASGKATVNDLYINRTYSLKQISVKQPYILDEEQKTFKVKDDENNALSIESNGTFKTIELSNTKKLVIDHENETKYTLVIKNTDLDTDANIRNASFKLTGKGYEDGTILTTNANGEYTLKNVYLNERYTFEQVTSDGYLRLTNSFVIDIVRNDETGEPEITLTRVPTWTSPTTRLFSNYCGLTYYSSDKYYTQENWDCSWNSGRYIYGYINVDLTGFKEQYQVSYDVSWRDSGKGTYMYTWIFDDKSEYPGPGSTGAKPTITINSSSYNGSEVNGTFSTNQISRKVDGQWVNLNFMGGKSYDVVLFERNGTTGNGLKIRNIKIQPVSGYDEQVAQESKINVPLDDNQNVLQTIQDSDDQDSPVLTVHVKSKKIPTYTLEVTKVDAETNEPLAGAQYKVEGPGLGSGKYITTDANGKASIELQKKYNHDVINDVDYSQIENVYTISEAVAPVGYMIDRNTIEFNGIQVLSDCTYERNGYTCDFSQENLTAAITTSATGFATNTFDASTNTVKVSLKDYPIVKITKKDGETGDLLPNTLFAVYKIVDYNGVTVDVPAVDQAGKVIGLEVEVDGQSYYVVKTDQNGNLNLNLPAGQYKLQEVQAADEKYEVTDAKYYFGVGETVPYKAEGIEYVDHSIRNLEKADYATYYIFKGLKNNYSTVDGGYIEMINRSINKYDANGNLEWATPAKADYFCSSMSEYIYQDDPDRKEIYQYNTDMCEFYASTAKIVETTDGYFVAISDESSAWEFDFVIKLDKNGNKVWQNQDYRYKYLYMMYGRYEADSSTYPSYYKVPGDDSHVYNSSVSIAGNINYPSIGDINIDANGNLLMFSEIGTYNYTSTQTMYVNGENTGEFSYHYYNYVYELPDGTIMYPDTDNDHYVTSTSTYNSETQQYEYSFQPSTNSRNIMYIFKYDSEGNYITNINYTDMLIDKLSEYVVENNLGTGYYTKSSSAYGDTGYSYIGRYNDGSILTSAYYDGDYILSLDYNQSNRNSTNSTSVLMKLDENLNPVYVVPVGLNGYANALYYTSMSKSVYPDNETGGLIYDVPYITDYVGMDRDSSSYKLLSPMSYDIQKIRDWDGNLVYPSGSYLIKIDGQGKLSHAVEYTRSKYGESAEANDILYGENNIEKLNGTTEALFYPMEDNSYIIAKDIYSSNNGNRIKLASGEMVTINPSTTSVIYKINSEGKIEWLKQISGAGPNATPVNFRANGSYGYVLYPYIETDDDGNLVLPFALYDKYSEVGNPDFTTITNDTTQSNPTKWLYLKYALSDEVQPSGPEAYTLTLENRRKEFKITAEANEGGKVIVTNPDNNNEEVVNTNASKKTTLETVKYGDNNIYNITIKPDAGYVIKSVKVNGKDINYTVNNDSSITLNKINDIKEEKNISITYEYGMSQVIVKHYLYGTTESIFSDEILTGQISTSYTTEPNVTELYSLAQENGEDILPDNMEGIYTVEPITVIYYYTENQVALRINYYKDGTSEELLPTSETTAPIGSVYATSAEVIPHYSVSRVLGKESGVLNKDLTEVTYMYVEDENAKVVVKYVDKDTNEAIAPQVVMSLPYNEEYTTNNDVTIPSNYRYAYSTPNTTGRAEQALTEVIYYYEKIPFNISVYKKINRLVINNVNIPIYDEKNMNIRPEKTDEVTVDYAIIVKNTGDIKSTFKVDEEDILGFVISDKKEFNISGDKYEVNVELEPGEEKTYNITYKWNQKSYGISTNNVSLKDVSNDLGFDEPDSDDNNSSATIKVNKPDTPPPATVPTKKTTTTTTTTEAPTTEESTTTTRRKTTTKAPEVKGEEVVKKPFPWWIIIVAVTGIGIIGLLIWLLPILLRKTVLVAISGSVGSAVAAKLLQERQCKVTGLFINNGTNLGQLTYAKQVCSKLGIDLYEEAIDKQKIVEAIAHSPNEDLDKIYNKVLIDTLRDVAKEQHIKYISTGTYATKKGNRIEPGINQVFDESTKLSLLTDEDIKKLLLPLGEIEYQEINKIAEQNNINYNSNKQTAIEKLGNNNIPSNDNK